MKFDQYVDLRDGPSALQKRGETSFDRDPRSLKYESERLKHVQSSPTNISMLHEARSQLYPCADESLKSPTESRA